MANRVGRNRKHRSLTKAGRRNRKKREKWKESHRAMDSDTERRLVFQRGLRRQAQALGCLVRSLLGSRTELVLLKPGPPVIDAEGNYIGGYA